MKKSLFLLAFLASLLLLSPKKTLASNPIRITGFDYPRNQQPFYNPFKSEDWGEDYVSEIVSAINNPNNFGGSGAIVNCGVSWLPFVNTIFPNSLVNGTQKTADVFIAGSITPELSSTEAMELKNFLQAGGVVFISGNSQGSPNADYHSFFELLGVNDRFSSEYDESEEIGISHTPISTPITNGAFGQVGRLGHLPFRIFNHSSLIPVAKAFEEGGFFTVLSFHTASTGLSENFILFEKGFGGGYLSVAGEPIYISDYNYENVRYFLNLVGYACGENRGGGEVGGSLILNVPLFKQTDPGWAELEYDSGNSQRLWCGGNIGKNIGQCGCTLTSSAMVLQYFGIDKDPLGRPTNPSTLNEYLKQDQKCSNLGCVSKGYAYGKVLWNAISAFSADANKVFGTQKIVFSRGGNYSYQATFEDIVAERPVILQNSAETHWILATGSTADTFTINDPLFNRTTLADVAYGNTAKQMRTYKKTASDFSSFEATSKWPTQLLATDPVGRRTGFDPQTNSVLEEIPNSFYFFERAHSGIANADDPALDGTYSVIINTPEHNKYDIQTIAPPDTKYSFAVHAADRDAGVDFNMFEANQPGTDNIYSFNYTPEPISETKFSMEISIDILPLLTKNIILSRPRYLIPVGIYSSNTFDANRIDKSTLKFGKSGAEDSLSFCFQINLNNDKLKDMTCLFKSWKTGFDKNDIQGILTAKTIDDIPVYGSDTIKVF